MTEVEKKVRGSLEGVRGCEEIESGLERLERVCREGVVRSKEYALQNRICNMILDELLDSLGDEQASLLMKHLEEREAMRELGKECLFSLIMSLKQYPNSTQVI